MLFIGGTRDGQCLHLPWNHDNLVFRIPIEDEPIKCLNIKDAARARRLYVVMETYVKKEIWEGTLPMFSVMVKDGSGDLLSAFLDKYNKRNHQR